MSTEQNNAPPQIIDIPPDLTERLRSRRPGYDRIFELWQEYQELPVDKRHDMPANEIFRQFVRPLFRALGWRVTTGQFPISKGSPDMSPFVLVHPGLEIIAGARPAVGPLSSERDADYELMQWASGNGFALLTNFETIRFWDLRNAQQPEVILESGPRHYLTDESPEVDLLAAENFYQRLARPPEPAQKGEAAPPIEQMQSESLDAPTEQMAQQTIQPPVEEADSSAQTAIPTEAPGEELPPPPNLGPYGQPDGPQQRFDEVMAGLSFGRAGMTARTITALVRQRDEPLLHRKITLGRETTDAIMQHEAGEPMLLLPGDSLSEGQEIIQPGPAHGGAAEDAIGVVQQVVFNERCVAALAAFEGDRRYLSTLPNGRPISGVAEPRPGLPICIFGAEQGYKQGAISYTDLAARNISMQFDERRALKIEQGFFIEDPDFSGAADVGALVLTPDTNQAVGVVLGQNEQGTLCLNIEPILEQLNVEFIPQPVRFLRQHQTADELTATNDLIGGEDRLGFRHYIDAFVRLIKDKNTLPPLTIGVYGAWGSGKSFLMDKIATALYPKQAETAGRLKKIWRRLWPSPRLWQTDTLVVRFEAWDYNATDKLWAGLVEQIFKTLETELGWYWLLRFNLKRNLQRQWRALRVKLLPYSLIAIVVGVLVVGFLLTDQGRWAVAVGGTTTLVLLARQLFDLFSTSASQRIVDMFASADYKQDIGFMGRIREDLEDFAGNLPDRPDHKMKVVVFIDDLDRCDPKKSVEVLEAIKLLLELDRFIVFLALDARIITQAVEQHYGKVLTEAEITGYEYLDKIVQIPFSIPDPPPGDLRNYLGSLVGMSQAEIPPLELAPAGREAAEPARFVAEAIEPAREGSEPPVSSPPPGRDASGAEPPATPQPAEPRRAGREAAAEEIAPLTDVPFDTIEVIFTPDEQKTFLDFHAHLDTNPRRLKRLVNIYKLVRVLISGQQNQAATGGPPPNHRHILGWLVVCEQWPYAAHVMLEIMADSYKRAETNPQARRALEITPLTELQQAAQQRIAREENKALQKLDLKYDRLESFIGRHLRDFTLMDLRRLKPFTVNFNPALSAEVRLTLSKGGS